MVFKTIESDITKSGQSLSVFRKEFKNVYRDFMSAVSDIKENGITKDGLKQFSPFRILGKSLSKQDIQALKNYNEEIRKYNEMTDDAVSPQTAFYKCLGNSSAAAQKLARDANGAAVSEKVLESETIRLTLAQRVSAIASKAMGTALKVALNVGLMLAINAIISGIINLVNKQEEAKQKAEELKQQTLENAQAVKEELNSISDLISQYEKFKDVTSLTSDDKATLKSIQDELVKTFGKEAEGIDLVNGEYREQLGLLQGIKQEKANQNINALISSKDIAKEAKNTNQKNEFEYFSSDDGGWKGYFESELVGIVENLTQKFPEFSYQTFSSGTTADTLKSAKIYLSEDLNAEEKVQALQEALEYMRAEGQTDNELFRYFSNLQQHYQEEVDNYNNALKDLAQGYIDAFEPLKDDATLKEFNEWKDKLLESIDDEEVKSATSELVDSLYKETSSAPNNTTILNLDKVSEETKTALSEYEDKISDFLSEKEKIDSALKEQEENGSISASTAFELSQTGYQYALKYDSDTKAYKLLREEINKTAESRRAETKAKLESEKASAIKSIQDEAERIKESTVGTKEYYSMYVSKLDDYKSAIQEVSDAYDFYISMLEDSDDATSDFSDTISKLNDKLEKCKESVQSLSSIQSTVKSATEEQNTFGRLSADTINALHEAGLDGATAYNEMTGETYLLVDAIDELTRAKIDNQKADIEQGIIDTTNAITKAQEDLNNLGVIDSPDDAAKALELNRYIAELEKTRADLQFQKQITTSYKFSFEADSEDIEESAEDAVEEYINSIKEAFDKEKSDLDHLLNMDVISQEEYYNRLFDLNEKYFKGKTELLDEYRQYEEEVYKGLKQVQIDAIQEQIDALKSVNEEKQEEIDLEKAKQALENAKRNKTISVYDSERGWIRETDRNAIDSAQKEYDDLVLNEQVEVLENLIDAIENGTNTNHNLDESVNAVEQVNSLGQRVISGNVDLTQLFSGAVANRMNEIQNSINSNIPIALANQFDKSISSDSYTTNNNSSITLNGVTVMANNPEEFIAQMEDIANERFKENFPSAMNQFGRDLQRYKMNHSL